MTTWVRNHFKDAKHAMTAISVMSVSMGVVGFGIIVVGAFLSN